MAAVAWLEVVNARIKLGIPGNFLYNAMNLLAFPRNYMLQVVHARINLRIPGNSLYIARKRARISQELFAAGCSC